MKSEKVNGGTSFTVFAIPSLGISSITSCISDKELSSQSMD